MLATSSITCTHVMHNEPDVVCMQDEEINTVAALKKHPACRHENWDGLSRTRIRADLVCMHRQGLPLGVTRQAGAFATLEKRLQEQ